MRIGIDARMYRSSVAGIGRYSQNLIRNLLEIDHENEYVLFMTNDDKQEFENSNIGNSLKIKNCKLKIIVTDIPHYSIAEQIKLPKIIERENLDLMHFLNFNYSVQYKGKFIVTIHDLTLFFYPATAKKTNFLKRLAFKYVMEKACHHASKIIAVSKATKKDVMAKFSVKSEKIQVIYEAADDKNLIQISQETVEKVKAKYHLFSPVILSVGQFRPHKNIPGLLRAFEILRRDLDCRLAILGKIDSKYQEVMGLIEKSQFRQDIILPGFVSDEELLAWYKNATVFVFPSFYEGFGLPGLEAMQNGLPVTAAKASSLPEVYGDAALYFEPLNAEDISDKIKKIIVDKNLRFSLIKRGSERARQYSWVKTAEETLKVYKEVKSSSSS